MKTLIISDDNNLTSVLDTFLTDNNIDTIIYKWLIKSIDNIEEIRPDNIIISCAEYPRHWKILARFINSKISPKKINLFLYVPNDLNEEELQKAQYLQVKDYLYSLKDSELKKLLDNQKADNFSSEIDDIPTIDDLMSSNDQNENVSGTGKYIFNDPVSNKIVSGSFFDFNSKKMTLNVDIESDIKKLTKNSIIKNFSYSYKDDFYHCNMKIYDFVKLNDNNLVIVELV